MERTERIGPYEILGRIGRGGSADVLLAIHAATGGRERVVIKRLHEHLAEDEIFVRMFLDEARVMSLLPHEGIVRVFDLGEDGATCYTAMELVDGPSLAAVDKLLREAGRQMPLDVLCAIGTRVADALAFVHQARDPTTKQPLDLVHRDVAAPNILVSRDGDVKLTDFGVVRSRTARSLGILSSETTKGGVLKGRKSTMAPEQVLGHAIDARADLFALGVVLWESAMGRKLWNPDAGALDVVEQIVKSPAPPLARADAQPALVALVEQLLEKAPDRRPSTALEVAMRLRALTGAPMRDAIARLVQSLGVPSLR